MSFPDIWAVVPVLCMKERTKKIMENPPASKTSTTLPPSAAERQLLRPIKINILTVSGVQKVRIQNCNDPEHTGSNYLQNVLSKT